MQYDKERQLFTLRGNFTYSPHHVVSPAIFPRLVIGYCYSQLRDHHPPAHEMPWASEELVFSTEDKKKQTFQTIHYEFAHFQLVTRYQNMYLFYLVVMKIENA